MDQQAQGIKAKRRRSRAEIEELITEYEGSGLGGATLLPAEGSEPIHVRSLSKTATADRKENHRGWLAVEVSGSAPVARGEKASGLVIVLSGRLRVEIGRDFDADTLKRLLAVLERGGACLE